MVVSTPEEIVNLGFDIIGESPIVSITGPTNKAEKFAARHYAPARDLLLRRHIWVFAKKWLKLTQESELTLDVDRPFAYKLSAEVVRVIRPSDTEWRIVGREIYSGIDGGLTVLCIVNDKSPAEFDALFVDALAALFALRYAEIRTQSDNKKARAILIYKEAIHEAKSVNALEEPHRMVFPDHASLYLAGHDGQVEAALSRQAVVAGGS